MLYWPDFFCKSLIDQGYHLVRFDNRDIGLSSKIHHKGPRLNTLKMMSRFVLGLGNQGAPYTLYDMADDVHLLIEKWAGSGLCARCLYGWHDCPDSGRTLS